MDYTAYLIVTPVVTGVVIFLMVMTIGYKKITLGVALFWYLLGCILFLTGSYLELFAKTEKWVLYFAALQHLALPIISVCWLVFSWLYTGFRDVFSVRRMWLLCLVPAADFIACLTNSLHHQYYVSLGLRFVENITIFEPTYGPLFWITSFYLYGMFVTGVFFVARGYIMGDSLYKRQALWVIFGFLLPMLVNLIYIFKIIPVFRKDYTPVAFAISGLFFFISIYGEKLLKLSPLSRNIILRDLQVGVVTLNHQRQLIDYNPTAALFTGISYSDLGKPIWKIPLGAWISEDLFDRNRNVEQSQIFHHENRIYEIKMATLEYSRKIAYLLTINDVTEKMELFERLEVKNRELLAMQNELIKQKKLAVIGRMAAGVAHEINNPISFIKSNHLMERRYLDKLEYDSKEGSSNKDILNNLLTINQESEEGLRRITNVVQNLLSFSRTGSSGDKSKYQINEEMTKTISLLGKATRERIHFLFELSQDIPELICYGNEINQVILNLVNNAVQSIPEDHRGEVILRSFTEGSRVIFEIEDNGKPIAERIKDELFEPFFTTKAGGKGTGLGLSLSQDIIEKRHKGVLCLKKGPKKIFRFELPIS